jgi:hypothetical protein
MGKLPVYFADAHRVCIYYNNFNEKDKNWEFPVLN